MPTITIDGKRCEYEGEKTILQVALENGIEIPHYCYHPAMSIVASCRICLAEVAQPNPRKNNQVELLPKLVPTCQTMAAGDMEIYPQSPKSVANQKAVMEYLLINHPLDCPVCDQAGECSLQDYSFKYGRSTSRFNEVKIKQPKKDLGPHVLLYADRCIMCSRCVRFTREVTGTAEIGVFGRGAEEQIDIFPGRSLDNALSANVIDICPVGALLDKDFLMSMRVWNLASTASIDGITCSGDNISIEHNEGRIYRVKPRTNLEVNQWWISDEIRFGWKFVHDEARLHTPMHRIEAGHDPCGWDEAYRQIADRLHQIVEASGSGSLGLQVSPMLSCEDAFLLGRLALALDPQAILGVGPIPRVGQNQNFPGGYTVYAEKCPNARGVRRVLSGLAETVLDHQQFLEAAVDTQAILLTGNYPSQWVTDSTASLISDKYTVLIDTLPGRGLKSADVVLPTATWAEKDGTFENVHGRLQSFQQAIPAIEMAKCEGQIALDLSVACGHGAHTRFNATEVRQEIGGALLTDVHHPDRSSQPTPDLQYVAL